MAFDIGKEYDDLASRVLFEDNHLLIVNKLPSDIVQGDKTGDMPLSEMYKYYLKKKYDKSGNVFLGVVHRLDRPTSGTVIFARTSKALSRMNKLLQEKAIEKYYWAVVGDCPEQTEGSVVHYMVRKTAKNKSYAYEKPRKDAKRAAMEYKCIGSSDRYSLLQIRLLTGRHHQIRSQLSVMGFPVKGDIKYGFHTTNKDASIHLHARFVSFTHPVKETMVSVTAAVPDEKLWQFFENKYASPEQ